MNIRDMVVTVKDVLRNLVLNLNMLLLNNKDVGE
jgi:hypothetical protein